MSDPSSISNADLAQILAKAREADATGGPGSLSTGEALAAALVLNRPDWLAAMDYTIAEAIERIGPEWARLVPAAAKQFHRDSDETAVAEAEKARQAKLATFAAKRKRDEEIECSASLVTHGSAPGYRDVHLTFDLCPMEQNAQSMRATLHIRAEDCEDVVRSITDVHRFAWRNGRPIDAKPDERRPSWIDSLSEST